MRIRKKKKLGARYFRFAGLGLGLLTACNPSTMVDVEPPNTVVDESTVTTAVGAIQFYNGARQTFAFALGGPSNPGAYVLNVGLTTDELMTIQALPLGVIGDTRTGNARHVAFGFNYGDAFSLYNVPRIKARQAREALRRYAPNAPTALQGELYALEGFAIVWLAELFCSGVPLSEVPLNGAPVPTPGFSTQQMFERAATLFDTAMTLGADSSRAVNLAKIGKGRALLGLGRFAEAAAAVQGVPSDFIYNAEFALAIGLFNWVGLAYFFNQVVDGEGGNGLVWSSDPRTGVMTTPATSPLRVTAKYSRTKAGTLDASAGIPDNPIRVADGLEARLIEAEAALAAGDPGWLTILNTLRGTCIGSSPCAPVPGLTAASLPPLADPGSAAARLDLLMQERAMWLFVTGHRQGDLRRLARIYNRDPATLWPTGTYVNPRSSSNGTSYGSDVVWQLGKPAESGNPLWSGCDNVEP